jgi:hypothetical protein
MKDNIITNKVHITILDIRIIEFIDANYKTIFNQRMEWYLNLSTYPDHTNLCMKQNLCM